jgi:hypothetical protein
MKIYLATSWKNPHHAVTLAALRAEGHEVYDFKAEQYAFNWQQLDTPEAMRTVVGYKRALAHTQACTSFNVDFAALKGADACVLLLPCGNDAHLEAGWVSGRGRPVVIYAPKIQDPGLMYKCFDDEAGATPLYATIEEVLVALNAWIPKAPVCTEACTLEKWQLRSQLAYHRGQVEGMTEGVKRIRAREGL